jgi:hypothetical protein
MLGELLDLLLSPIALLLAKRRATPEEIHRFYRSVAWKRGRYETFRRSPARFAAGPPRMAPV